MSEKRFDIQFNKKNFIRMFDNEKNEVVTETKAVDLLNSLVEENEQLEKGKMEALSLLGEEIDKNEYLRQEIVHLKEDLQYYKTKSGSLEEELLSKRLYV